MPPFHLGMSLPCSGNYPACFPVWDEVGLDVGIWAFYSNMQEVPHLTSTVPVAGNPATLLNLGLFVHFFVANTTGSPPQLVIVAYMGPRATTEE